MENFDHIIKKSALGRDKSWNTSDPEINVLECNEHVKRGYSQNCPASLTEVGIAGMSYNIFIFELAFIRKVTVV